MIVCSLRGPELQMQPSIRNVDRCEKIYSTTVVDLRYMGPYFFLYLSCSTPGCNRSISGSDPGMLPNIVYKSIIKKIVKEEKENVLK